MTTNDLELAWAAGIVDGDGYITIRTHQAKGGRYYTAIVYVKMTHSPTVERLKSLFGCGSTHQVGGTSAHKKSLVWTALGADALRVIEALRPYLFTKSEIAEFVAGLGGKYDAESHAEAKRLNRRGPVEDDDCLQIADKPKRRRAARA
jgi:hypothetical protein